jgi:hypothetical protein
MSRVVLERLIFNCAGFTDGGKHRTLTFVRVNRFGYYLHIVHKIVRKILLHFQVPIFIHIELILPVK